MKGKHVIPGWLDMFLSFLRARCIAGGASLERGKRHEHLHIQGICRMRLNVETVGSATITLLRNQIKGSLGVMRGDKSGCAICIKPFAAGQMWQV